jgi:CRISPR/Cas system CSM-associated protein Csm3 (group 7 of RAMP superfamily)
VDMLPMVSAIDDHLTFVLPGSSIKGAFRSQAERIVRTLKPIEALAPVRGRQDFIKQVEVKEPKQSDDPQHASLIGWLFGIAARPDKKDKEEDDKSRHPLPGFSAVTIDDCYADLDFDSTQWAGVEQATDEQKLRENLDAAGLGRAQQAFHVAIDRWLGSAADGFLYSVLEPHGISWEPIRLTLDLARLPDEDCEKHAVMLLLLTLRDFVAGRIPLGFGANRGMGHIEVTGVTITPNGLTGDLARLRSVKVQDGRLLVEDADLRKLLNESWQSWCKPQPEGASA